MMVKKKKKKQSRSTEKKTLEPKLLPIFHSKLASGKDMKHMIRGMSSIPVPGLSSQSRVVRCPKCHNHKFLQEPVDVTIYKCSGCDSILQETWPWLNHKEDMESQNESCYEGVYGREDRAGLHLEEYETNYENYYSNPFEWTTPTFHVPEYEPEEGGQARSESSSFSDHEEEPWLVDYNKTKELQVVGVVVEDGPSLHFDKCGYESTTLEETLESTPKFYLHEPELLEPDNEADGSWESSSTGSFNSHESSKLRAMDHEEEDDDPWLVDDCETKALKVHVMAEDGASLHLEKFENEKMLLDQRVEPREDIFRLSLDDTVEEEWVTFDLETSQEDKEVNLRQTFKLGDTEENTPTPASASGSMLSEEEILRDQLEHFQKENEKSRRTSEVVGLRHALYQTQTSPLSTLPIDNPIGSPRHILMRSHMVSPLRSLTNSSGSLSDVLSLPKKT
ncbi:BnaA09g35860D [Brassica napus]|uniref:BnaA09g35860D protein n=1 Tax=Brassica napus TaxID=3708 RepID=A0A078GPF0_BRANA|nr:BnaA09g35860D [Brassica napus]